MASRKELSDISNAISAAMAQNSNYKVSEMPELLTLLKKPGVGQIFLIICESMPAELPYYSLHTKEELGIDQIPTGYFSKPGGLSNFNVLVKQHRTFAVLREKKWL